MRNFFNLDIWKLAHQISKRVYLATLDFPKSELFGLTSQIRRAAVSIPSNIAEGCGRDTNGDFRRFLTIAAGSCSELQYLLLLTAELGLLEQHLFKELNTQLIELRKKLFRFIHALP